MCLREERGEEGNVEHEEALVRTREASGEHLSFVTEPAAMFVPTVIPSLKGSPSDQREGFVDAR